MKLFSSKSECIEIPVDEYLFHSVLKKGRIVSSPSELYAEAIDFSSARFIFRMSLLESSSISEQCPDFDSVGLLGQWRLGTNGLVRLVQASQLKDPEQIKKFLKDPQSNSIFSKYY